MLGKNPSPNDAAPAAGAASASRARLHHHEMVFLDALQLLIETGRARTVEDLIRYAEQARQPQAAEFLREKAEDGLPVDLAFDALSVHVRIVAYKRNHSLLQACRNAAVGLVLPLPPHVLDAFLQLPKATVLVPDGKVVPPPLRRRSDGLVQGTRAGREAAGRQEYLVIEAYRSGDDLLVDPGTADVADPRLLPEHVRLVVHQRAHRNPDDIPLPGRGARPLDVL